MRRNPRAFISRAEFACGARDLLCYARRESGRGRIKKMKESKNRTVFLRICLGALTCLAFGIYPVYVCERESGRRLGKLDAERDGAKMLGCIAAAAHGAYLKQTGSPLYEKDAGEFAAALENIAGIGGRLFNSPRSRDASNVGFASRNIVGRRVLDSFFDNAGKGGVLADLCRFAVFHGGLFTDGDANPRMLVKILGGSFPRIYGGIYEMSLVLAADLEDKKTEKELQKSFAVLDEYTRAARSDLRKVSSAALSGPTAAAAAKLDSRLAELGSLLSKNFGAGGTDAARVQAGVDNFEDAARGLWTACAENLSASVEERRARGVSDLKIFRLSIFVVAVLCVLASALILLPVGRFRRDTATVLRAALSGTAADALKLCDLRLRGGEGFFASSDDVADIVEKYAEVLERAESAEKKFSDAAEEKLSEAGLRQSALDRLASSASLAREKCSAGAAEISAASRAAVLLHDNVSAVEQVLRAQAKTASGLSADLRAASGRVAELARGLAKARGAAEKMSVVAETFTGIADRANILSLNLSIAAARRGTKLSGLSALAERMRLLSGQIAVSVLDIEGVGDAVADALDSGIKSSETAAELVGGNVKVSDGINAALESASSSLSAAAADADSLSARLASPDGVSDALRGVEQSARELSLTLTLPKPPRA